MGLPIVATDIRGCRQVVDDGVTGLLVPVNEPASLARTLVQLAGDPADRGRYAAAGRTKAQREFDQSQVIDTTLATYQRLAG